MYSGLFSGHMDQTSMDLTLRRLKRKKIQIIVADGTFGVTVK